MKFLKNFQLFESEIWNGARLHFNGLKPVNQTLFDMKKLYDYHCDNCDFDFKSYDANQTNCSICESDRISKVLI